MQLSLKYPYWFVIMINVLFWLNLEWDIHDSPDEMTAALYIQAV